MRAILGCERCYRGDAPALSAAWPGQFAEQRRLVDEPRRVVTLHVCRSCGQLFLRVLVGATGGGAPRWVAMPLRDQEVAALLAKGGSLRESDLAALGPDRRFLEAEQPPDAPAHAGWRHGPLLGGSRG